MTALEALTKYRKDRQRLLEQLIYIKTLHSKIQYMDLLEVDYKKAMTLIEESVVLIERADRLLSESIKEMCK